MPKPITPELVTGNVLHEWEVSEYERHERSTRWYVIMMIIGVFFIGYALFTQNFLFALIIVLFAIILFLQAHQDAPIIGIKITDLGLVIHNRFYEYSELGKFYIIYNPPEVKTVFVETDSSLRPRLRLPLLDNDPNEIRFTLRQHLVEDTEIEEEPLSDRFARSWRIH